jgi:hypothetical protein
MVGTIDWETPDPAREPNPAAVTGIKIALAVLTLLLMVSFGGQVLIPILTPLHVWAANRSGPIGRVLWAVPTALSTAAVGWVMAYELFGEAQPMIWLMPLLAALAGGWVFGRVSATPRSRREADLLRARLSRAVARRSTRPAAALAAALAIANTALIQSMGPLLFPFVWILVGGVVLAELSRPRGARDRWALALVGFAFAGPWLFWAVGAVATRNLG